MGHRNSKSFCHPFKILPFSPSFWSLKDYHSFCPSYVIYSIFFWQTGFPALGPSNPFPHFPLTPEISRVWFWSGHHPVINNSSCTFPIQLWSKSSVQLYCSFLFIDLQILTAMICLVPSSHTFFSSQVCPVTCPSHVPHQLQSTVSKFFASLAHHLRCRKGENRRWIFWRFRT